MSFKLIRLSVMAPAAVLLVAVLCIPFHITAGGSLANELMAIAQESLNAQYETLVSGDSDRSLKGKRFAARFRGAIANQLTEQVRIRNGLMKTRQDYKGFRLKLLFQELVVKDDKAQLKATEITELDMNPPPGGPTVTKSSDPHVFEFARINGEWQLESDVIIRPQPTVIQNGEELPIVPLPPPTTDRPKSSSRKHHASLPGPRLATAPPASAPPLVNYDRVAAINYARAHALNYNTDYKRFNNDCTNFISQSLFAGGWQMVGSYANYTHDDVWWYSCMLPGGYVCKASYTWGAAYNFHAFLNTGPGHRTDYVQYYGDVWPGDLIFADWDSPGVHQPDGRIDHIMFVTGRDTEGNLYISQHTTDRLDRPFAQVELQETSARFYGHRVKDSY